MDANQIRWSDRTPRTFPAVVQTCFSFVQMHNWQTRQPLWQGTWTGILDPMEVRRP
jgi:hypothetical protein